MTVGDFLPVLIQAVIAIGIALVIITASHIFGVKGRPNKTKDSAYECGIIGTEKHHTRFSVKFYVTAMLFILFDIEVVFLIPWILIYREFLAASIPILLPILAFLGVMILGLVYELKKGGIEWER